MRVVGAHTVSWSPYVTLKVSRPDTATCEVWRAVSSRAFDMGVKARRYAAAGYPEYWVVDAARLEVVVQTGPSPDGWQHITTVTEGVLTPAAVPSVEVDLAVLFAGAS